MLKRCLVSVVLMMLSGMSLGEEYVIQPGDVLQVSVWKEEGLQHEVLVRPDGGISFPLAGDIDAHDMTVVELQAALSERIGSYIPEPVVTVALSEVVGNKIYVLGKVSRPGEFVVTKRVDVMQALSMAGGTTTFAALNEIKILRRDGRGVQESIGFRYGDVEKGLDLGQNIELESGDVVVVP